MENKTAREAAVIGGADGPTSIFLAGGYKPTIKQKLQKAIDQYKKNKIIRSVKAEPHSLEQVIEYVKERWGYSEKSKDCREYQEEYAQTRASLLLQYKPELLGDLAEYPKLKTHAEEDIKFFMKKIEQRQKAAEEIPAELFDIDLCILGKEDNESHSSIIIEKTYGHIGGSAAGNKSALKEFHEVLRDVYQYYGVAQSDIDHQTRRYKELVDALNLK